MSFTIDLAGKVVLITGAASGIGAAVAEQYARAGARLAGCGLEKETDEGAIAFKQLAHRFGTDGVYMQVDLTDSAQLERLVKGVIDHFKRLDILVSNAGANVFEGAEACTEAQWTYNQELNLGSHWRLAKLCKPWLETSYGIIIIMTSNHAFASIPGCFPYNIAKAGLTALVRSLAIEWGPTIRSVGLAPGFIDTPGNRAWFASFPDPALERKRTEEMHPVKRIGTPEEVGAWCVFLASEYAAFASGVTYLVDGGRSALLQDPAG
jgi:NAD(P)-dependent dehydrogenase (short-subunit alcohol dehydrogenase family)